MNWNRLTTISFWHDSHRILFCKDSRSMADLPDEFVQCVVTSPPFWGLRKYAGLPDLIWGDKNDCQHRFDMPTMAILGFNTLFRPEGETSTPLGLPSEIGKYAETVRGGADRQQVKQVGNFCSLCGAWKGAYGLEPTPEMYVQHTIEILREIRRVLRKDGVVFWNIGDSYMSGGGASRHFGYTDPKWKEARAITFEEPQANKHPIIKPKDLCLIPFRVAISAQDDGWWIRSVIIWNKPNPMPESVRDRPTESHEYILMLTKSLRYYWDPESVRTKFADATLSRVLYPTGLSGKVAYANENELGYGAPAGRDFKHLLETGGANLRSVWTFPTQGYPEAHFAVFPEKLPEICIKAATPEVGCCSKCGKPWERIVKPSSEYARVLSQSKGDDWFPRQSHNGYGKSRHTTNESAEYETLGWQPACTCNADKVPSIVLDPFAGSGTTLKVAAELNRRAIGYELSEPYCRLIVEGNKQSVMNLEL